jgi:uncharacterized protein (DUF58 family)
MNQNTGLRWLLIGMAITGLVGWLITGLTVYARIAYLGSLLIIGGAIWALLSIRGIHFTRQARTLRASMGEVFEEHFEVIKESWLGSLWVEVLNQSDLPMAGGSRLLTGIGPRQRRSYSARTLLYRRGAFTLGPTRLSSGDPFGLFTFRRLISAKDTLVVLPMVVPIKDFPPPPGVLPGGKAVRQRSMDVTPHAAGVREYVPGDPMKRIHWPTTAHRGRFMVKEFEQDPQADIWLFLDALAGIQVSSNLPPEDFHEIGLWLKRPKITLPADTFEYAISTAASLADHFLAHRRSVGLACAAGKLSIVPADRGERQVNKIMETLAFLQPTGTMPLLSLVTMQAKLLPIGAGIIIITSSVRPELLFVVEDLLRRRLSPVVVIIKPESFGGSGDSGPIIGGLLNHNIPVCSVGMGDDLSVKLALPVVYFQSRSSSNSYFGINS